VFLWEDDSILKPNITYDVTLFEKKKERKKDVTPFLGMTIIDTT
jgi:hypothetical protein